MIGDNVQHGLNAEFIFHFSVELGKTQVCRFPVLIDLIKVIRPIAVITGLSFIRANTGTATEIPPSGELRIGVGHDWRNPDRGKAHFRDVICVIGNTLEVSAKVANVRAVRAQFNIECTLRTLVVTGITVDKSVGHDEVNRFRRKGFVGTKIVGRESRITQGK